MTYPSKRDCEHGSQRGRCDICDIIQADRLIEKIARTLHTDEDGIVRAIQALQADNNYLREVIRHLADPPDRIAADAALSAVPHNTIESLEAEFDMLRSQQMTPKMEAIIQAVHDQAGRECESDGAITVTISQAEYEMLCQEEEARDL